MKKTKCRRFIHQNHLIEVKDDDGNVAYGSDLKSVAEALGVTVGAISNALHGHIMTVKDCTFRYVDSITLEPVK